MENKYLLMISFGVIILFLIGLTSQVINFDNIIHKDKNEVVRFEDSKLKQDMEAKGVKFPEQIVAVALNKIGDSDGS